MSLGPSCIARIAVERLPWRQLVFLLHLLHYVYDFIIIRQE